jgi:hypothetical protein
MGNLDHKKQVLHPEKILTRQRHGTPCSIFSLEMESPDEDDGEI